MNNNTSEEGAKYEFFFQVRCPVKSTISPCYKLVSKETYKSQLCLLNMKPCTVDKKKENKYFRNTFFSGLSHIFKIDIEHEAKHHVSKRSDALETRLYNLW